MEKVLELKTLEEVGVIAAGLCEHLEAREQAFFIAGFQECIKWQQERMYSEEDLKKIIYLTWLKCLDANGGDFIDNRNEILEQFKNK